MSTTLNTLPAWAIPFASIYMVVFSGYIWWMWRYYRHHKAIERLRLDLRAQQPTRSMSAMPSVLPAHLLDASDTTPDFGNCPECYLLWLHRATDLQRTADGGYVMPAGAPALCTEHASSTLGRAIERKEMAR